MEAACVLPIFLYFMLAFLYFLPAVCIQGSVTAALGQVGKELAVSAYAVEAGEEGLGLTAGQLTAGYAKRKILSRMKTEDVNTSVIQGGNAGISLSGSVFLENEMIVLNAAYHFRFPVPLFYLKRIPVIQCMKVRAWTGRTGSKDDSVHEEDNGNDLVFVTEEGAVYHKDENCSHIRLSVRMADSSKVAGLRNQNGGKYYPCESCGGTGMSVYITDTGDRYHSSVSCRGLKRTLRKVPVSSLEGWGPCKRCGG